MTGSIINELLGRLNRDRQATNAIELSELSALRESSFLKTLTCLRLHAAQKDIHNMLLIEQACMAHALQFDANSPEEKQSLAAGIEQAAEAAKCLHLISNNPEGYAAFSADLYGSKDREAGLPLDPFRKFLKSQSARLTNRLAGEGSHNKKLILRQRKMNLGIIKECYIELQQKACGVRPRAHLNRGLGS